MTRGKKNIGEREKVNKKDRKQERMKRKTSVDRNTKKTNRKQSRLGGYCVSWNGVIIVIMDHSWPIQSRHMGPELTGSADYNSKTRMFTQNAAVFTS
jgi:hypothetical protein